MANAIQHKPVHEVRLRSQENEVSDKGGRAEGTLSGICSSSRVCHMFLAFCEIANRY